MSDLTPETAAELARLREALARSIEMTRAAAEENARLREDAVTGERYVQNCARDLARLNEENRQLRAVVAKVSAHIDKPYSDEERLAMYDAVAALDAK